MESNSLKTKQDLLQEVRGKIIIQYAGHKCFVTLSKDEIIDFTLKSFREVGESNTWYFGDGSIGTYPARIVTVKVKPLAEIPEEDAEHVFDIMLAGNRPNINMNKISIANWNQWLQFATSEGAPFYANLQAADFLRSRGYALPYGEYSVDQLVEAGIYKFTDNGK